MNILIAYSSKTGNTKTIAEAIKETIPNSDILSISEIKNTANNIENYDLIFLGGWIDKGTFNTETLEFVKDIKNKKIAYFFTLGAYPESDHAKDCVFAIDKLLTENLNKIIDKFFCQGAIDPKLIEFMKKLPQDHIMAPNEERIKRWNDAKTHPDNNDIENAKIFSMSVINKI